MKHPETGVEGAVKADFSTFPTPPEGAEGEAQGASGRAGAVRAPEEAILEFENPEAMIKVEPLNHPFRHKGDWLREVTIRRMTFAQAMRASQEAQAAGRELTNVDLFAAMTGLPAGVIRGMEASDGERVTDACLDFLPRPGEASASS